MKWQNVKLIFSRELRDQLRDRRTLFTVAVMPILLYPLMGMAMLQVGQFMREYPTKVWVIGAENVPQSPQLLVDGEFNPEIRSEADGLLELQLAGPEDQPFRDLLERIQGKTELEQGTELVNQLIQEEMKRRKVDVAVFFPLTETNENQTANDPKLSDPSGIPPQLNRDPPSDSLGNDPPTNVLAAVPVFVFHNSANDKSRIGSERVNGLLSRWKTRWAAQVLDEHAVPLASIEGMRVTNADVAKKSRKRAALWSKILPLIVVIWSLTGAFYPAIDLCAGEKERGTFETLLSSPAARSEIAIGKLLTVMSFSMATSLLNLISMGFTGIFVVSKMGSNMGVENMPVGAPPLESFMWLVLALIPISALFSAVALAAAAFARSSKEGQYYLVPLMMISMPLMMVPMLPAARLDLGTALIPVSGLMLLLRGLIEGQYAECARYVAPVCIVTLACCWIAVRWVVAQFNSEAVLFRASERINLTSWVQYLMRERHEMPSFCNAIVCGLFILVAKFFIGFVVQTPDSFWMFGRQTVIILVATIGVPAVIMALVLTCNPRKSLRLVSCTLPMAAAAVLAALLLNPLFTWLSALVLQIYPPAGNVVMLEQIVSKIMADAPGLWAILLVFAVAPAVIEEVAFRGFILSGMEAMRNKWQAILMTSLLFGLAHSVIQQSIITFFVGMILGVIAVQTKSIIPCVLFHAVHNSMAVLLSQAKHGIYEASPLMRQVLVTQDGVNFQYGLVPGLLMTLAGVLLIVWYLRLDVGKPTEDPALSIGKKTGSRTRFA